MSRPAFLQRTQVRRRLRACRRALTGFRRRLKRPRPRQTRSRSTRRGSQDPSYGARDARCAARTEWLHACGRAFETTGRGGFEGCGTEHRERASRPGCLFVSRRAPGPARDKKRPPTGAGRHMSGGGSLSRRVPGGSGRKIQVRPAISAPPFVIGQFRVDIPRHAGHALVLAGKTRPGEVEGTPPGPGTWRPGRGYRFTLGTFPPNRHAPDCTRGG